MRISDWSSDVCSSDLPAPYTSFRPSHDAPKFTRNPHRSGFFCASMVPGVPLPPANRGGICGGPFGDIGLLGASMDKLSATATRNAKPVDQLVRLFDGRGLSLEVTPTGLRYWRRTSRYAGKATTS